MRPIAVWLENLQLGQYAERFTANGIDLSVLPHVTEGDLKELGVLLGHRRKLLRAIADLAAPPPASDANPAWDAAERRQLTVMFCDLVGSTALAARLDPEDMSEVIRSFQATVASVVGRFDGHVAKLMGDGALIYFGYPQAHEDDAERAVRAGLGVADAVRGLRRRDGTALEVRTGIATGLVVVGELIGEGEAQERGVVGETPNLAARLETLAEPGTVVVSPATRRLLGEAFALKSLGRHTLKGFAAAIEAWSVLGERENVSRFEATRAEGITPFVGREHEVALLLNRWREAKRGEGQVALLSGEAGIGKSRIAVALRESIAGEPHAMVRYQCSPYHSNEALYPIIGQIWHAARFVAGEPAAARLEKLESMIARCGLDLATTAPYLASLLSIPVDGRYPPLAMTPGEIKERTIAALIAMIAGLSREAPLLALLEDAHWIDPTTLDLFNRTIEQLPAMRVFLVVTFRPEFTAPWVGRAHVATLTLNRFDRRQIGALIHRVIGGKALPPEVLEQIVVRTDGVPLFVEELTKTVLESGLLREQNGAYVLATATAPLTIPSTLHDSLMARLDRLARVKEIAQIGAVIGRQFSYRLMEAVAPLKGAALEDALRHLTASELVYGRGTPPDASYIFKHALVQDAAYASLLRARRQKIHAEIAQALADRFADQVESAPAVVAHHYTEAGLAGPAVRHWAIAAEQALSRSAPAEASRYVEAGLALIPGLPEGPERRKLELALHVARGNAQLSLKGYVAPETVAAFTEAKRLLDAGIGTDPQRYAVLYGLFAANYVAARVEPALALARQIVEVADRQADVTYRLVAYRLLGASLLFSGRLREALESLQHAEQYRDPAKHKALSYRFAMDPGLAVLFWKIWALLLIGLADPALKLQQQVQMELPDHGHVYTVATGRFFAVVWPALVLGDIEATERDGAELIAYCAEKKVEQFRLFSVIAHACARATRDPSEENIAAARAAFDAEHRSGGRISDSVFISQFVQALLAAGDVSGAETELRAGFAFVEESGERFWLAELHRLDGRIALAGPKPNQKRAEASFRRAMAIAHEQESRLLELRAATDLARLRRASGTGDDLGTLVTSILATIEGGGSTADIRNAHAVIGAPD